MGRITLTLAAVMSAGVLASCGVTVSDADSQAGLGLPTVTPDQVAGARTELAGTLHVESNGCFTWSGDDDASERRWVVWPASASHDDVRVVLADGVEVTDGDVVVGEGRRADATALPEWEHRDSWLRSFGTFCDADDRGVVVFDEVRPAGS